MKVISLCLLSALLCTAAHAQLGQTKKACAERYGEPDELAGDVLTYHKAGFNIRASFVDGTAAFICYVCGQDKGSIMSKSELAGLFNDNLGKERVAKMKPPEKGPVMVFGAVALMAKTDDGKAGMVMAGVPGTMILMFMSLEHEKEATALLSEGIADLLPRPSSPAQQPPKREEETPTGPSIYGRILRGN